MILFLHGSCQLCFTSSEQLFRLSFAPFQRHDATMRTLWLNAYPTFQTTSQEIVYRNRASLNFSLNYFQHDLFAL